VEDNISELVKKGSELIVEGDFEKALSYFEQAIILKPNDPDLLNKKRSRSARPWKI